MRVACLLHHLPQVMLHKHRRSRYLVYFDVPVEVVEAIDGHLLSHVLQFCLKNQASVLPLLAQAPPLLDNLGGDHALSVTLFVELLNAIRSINGYPLLDTWIEWGTHELQVTLIQFFAKILRLDAAQVYVRTQIDLV